MSKIQIEISDEAVGELKNILAEYYNAPEDINPDDDMMSKWVSEKFRESVTSHLIEIYKMNKKKELPPEDTL